jgi:hypothetical protein
MIIGLCGLIGSGKSEVAKILLQEFDMTYVPFAKPLKDMLAYGLGLSDDQLYGTSKEVPSELLCGKTPRWAMQSLGTEWGRGLIHPDLWVRAWARRASQSPNVVSDDLRFANEAKTVKACGGLVVKVSRPGQPQGSHPSESLDFPYDYELLNSGTLEEFRQKVREWRNSL